MANDSARVHDELDVVLDGRRHLYRSELGPEVEAATLLAEEFQAIQLPAEVAERHIAMALDQAGSAAKRARRRLLARALATMTAAAVIVGIPSLVSGGTLPGHPLYPLKRTIEAADLAVHLDPCRDAEIQMRIAQRRIGELDALLRRNDRTHLLGAIREVKLAVEAANAAVAKAFRSEGVNRDTMALRTQLTGVTMNMMQGLEEVVVTAAPTDPVAASTASSILGSATTTPTPGAPGAPVTTGAVPPPTTSPPPPTHEPQPPTTAEAPPTTAAEPPTTGAEPPPTTAAEPAPPTTAPGDAPTTPGASTADTSGGGLPTGP